MKKTTVVLDFDGTLAGIVADPRKAYVGREEKRRLAELASKARVVILTGRPSDFVKKKLAGIGGLAIMGLHGNRPSAKTRQMRRAERLVGKKIAGIRGVLLETKPGGFAVHYRTAHPGKAVGRAIGEARKAGKEGKLRIIRGRKTIEFLEESALVKADALEKIVRKRGRAKVVFVGDDQSDYDAIKRCRAYRNFIGVMVENSETGFSPKTARPVARGKLFSLITELL